MNGIKIFENNEFGTIRAIDKNGKPWFVLNDICDALDLTRQAIAQRLTDDVSSTYPIKDNMGRLQETKIINEDGLYDAIFESRKPNAKRFRKWVTSEVLPSIRKTGSYSTNQNLSSLDILNQMTAVFNEQAKKLDKVEGDIQTIRDTIVIDHKEDDWRKWANSIIVKVARKIGNYQLARTQSYELLEQRAKCDLTARLRNAKGRALEQGWSKTKIDKLNKLDCIDQEPRLKEIYIAIVKQMAIKHGIES